MKIVTQSEYINFGDGSHSTRYTWHKGYQQWGTSSGNTISGRYYGKWLGKWGSKRTISYFNTNVLNGIQLEVEFSKIKKYTYII